MNFIKKLISIEIFEILSGPFKLMGKLETVHGNTRFFS